jgi:hypothetical protein
MTYLALGRRFVERQTYNDVELHTAKVWGKLVGWEKVLGNRCCVVVAPANFGKTTEMEHQAIQMRAEGHAAVFVALRRLADRTTLARSLTGDELEAYRNWQASPGSPLTVFVDSLDEAAAGRKDNIEYLLGDVATELGWPNESVRWVISTRPAVLTAEVFQKLTALLTKKPSKTRSAPGKKSESEASASDSPEQEKLPLFSMAPLERGQAAAYLAGRHPELEAKQLMELAAERGLGGFMESPGGLDILARIDLVSNPPTSLTEVFERVATAIEMKIGDDPRLEDAGRPAPDALTTAAQRLAAACQVCQRVNIEMSSSSLDVPTNAISARRLVASQLNEAATRQLLTSQLFIDAGFSQVKVYPDELLPFLAAKRLAGLVESSDQAERLLENFTWEATSGEQGVQRAYLPMMGWLATLNSHCREVILRKDPQALAFFGDLRNPLVPADAAREALTNSIERMVLIGDQPGRGMFTLTSENYWQAGPKHMAATIGQLYKQHHADYWARDVLTDIATACKLEELRSPVLRLHGRRFSRVLTERQDVAYLVSLGKPEDLHALASAAIASTTLRDSVASFLLHELGWAYFSPRDVAVLADDQLSEGQGAMHIGYTLASSAFLSSATDDQLFQLSRGLVIRLAKAPNARTRRGYREKQRYAEAVAPVLEALVLRSPASKLAAIARLYSVFHRVTDSEWLQSDETRSLAGTVSRSSALRRELLTSITRRGLGDDDLLVAVVGYARVTDFLEADVVAVANAQLSRVYAAWKARTAAAAAAEPPTPPKKVREPMLKVNAKSKAQLKKVLPSVSNGTEESALAWIARWLLQTNPHSRYGDINFEAFERAAGAEIADAARKGMSRLWRDQPPRFREETPNSTFHIAAAGLQGLHLEFGDGTHLPKLTDDEVRRALRYGLIEINGYPKWFWPLVEAHPKVGIAELVAITQEAGNGASSREHAEELLGAVPEAPTFVREALAGLAWTHLTTVKPTREHLVNRLLSAALSVPGKVPQRDFERIALQKITSAWETPLPDEPDTPLQEQRSEALTWASRWLSSAPMRFRNAVNAWGPRDALAVKGFLFDLAADFGRDREGVAAAVAKGSGLGVMALEDLFLWTHWAVDPALDPEHPSGVTYSPDRRDHAAQFRSSLISAIAQANSQAAYDALGRIRDAMPPGDNYIDYTRRAQFELRERQLTREPLAQVRYDQFERDFRGEVTGTTSFAMAVQADLHAVRYDIERGDHSLRSFFSEVDFKHINTPGAPGEKAGLALEVHFQRLLASELNHHARRRYSITMEPHTAESKRRDVYCSKGDWGASIELKMSERWTLEEYLVALEDQLVGQYMRNNKATIGFLVVVLQRDRRWTDPTTGKKTLTFADVLNALSRKAQALEAADRSRYLRVIGIDATKPADFRAKSPSNPRQK